MARAIISLPKSARRGEVIEIKTLVQHPMETGFRRTQLGEVIPRDIIRNFACRYDGETVFRADLHPAVAANPAITFAVVATRSGKMEFSWTGDNGFALTQTASLAVE